MFLLYVVVTETPTSLSKLSRDSKESTPTPVPAAAAPAAAATAAAVDDVKRPIETTVPVPDRKKLLKENSHESDSGVEIEKKVPHVSRTIFLKVTSF